jgi:hypothetical protein
LGQRRIQIQTGQTVPPKSKKLRFKRTYMTVIWNKKKITIVDFLKLGSGFSNSLDSGSEFK